MRLDRLARHTHTHTHTHTNSLLKKKKKKKKQVDSTSRSQQLNGAQNKELHELVIAVPANFPWQKLPFQNVSKLSTTYQLAMKFAEQGQLASGDVPKTTRYHG